MNVLRAEAIAQAGRILDVLERDWPGARERLQHDTLAELRNWPGIQVRTIPDSQTDARCSVAGGYVHTTSPPTLTITMSLSVRRQAFTALHELAHHLQKNDFDLAVAVRRQPADVTDFEDAACDAFAGRVLIPDDLLAEPASGRSPATGDVVKLFERTRASRAACCVRIAERLSGHGVVALLDDMGRVAFASGRGDVYPPARSSDQSSTPLVASALRTGAAAQHDTTRVLYRNRSTSVDLYGDAAWCDGYLIMVAVTDRPGWKSFAPPRPATGKIVPHAHGWCELCEEEFPVAGRCDRCHEPRCPAGHCACSTARDRPCKKCFLVKHPTLFPGPAAEICTDCSS